MNARSRRANAPLFQPRLKRFRLDPVPTVRLSLNGRIGATSVELERFFPRRRDAAGHMIRQVTGVCRRPCSEPGSLPSPNGRDCFVRRRSGTSRPGCKVVPMRCGQAPQGPWLPNGAWVRANRDPRLARALMDSQFPARPEDPGRGPDPRGDIPVPTPVCERELDVLA